MVNIQGIQMEDQENISVDFNKYMQSRKQRCQQLLNEIEVIHESDDSSVETAKKVQTILKKVNSINNECPISRRVKHADETLIDSKVVSTSSTVLTKCLENLDITTVNYDSNEFASKIDKYFNDKNGSFEFIHLLKEFARDIIPENPNYETLFGAYEPDAPPPPRKERVVIRREAQTNEPKKNPKKIVHLEKEEKGIEETVNFLQKVLQEEFVKNGQKSISFYRFVIDKSSFSTTVENIFHSSFLVRDGKASVDVDKNGELIIQPVSKRELKQFRENQGKNSQFIMNISMDQWEKFDFDKGYLEQQKDRSI